MPAPRTSSRSPGAERGGLDRPQRVAAGLDQRAGRGRRPRPGSACSDAAGTGICSASAPGQPPADADLEAVRADVLPAASRQRSQRPQPSIVSPVTRRPEPARVDARRRPPRPSRTTRARCGSGSARAAPVVQVRHLAGEELRRPCRTRRPAATSTTTSPGRATGRLDLLAPRPRAGRSMTNALIDGRGPRAAYRASCPEV